MALYRATDEVLHYVWDPIGVSDQPYARDEYQAYLPQVFGMLQEGSGAERVADYLTRVSVEKMGLAARSEHDRKVAELLVEWRRVINEREA